MADATAQGGSSARDGETAALASEAHPHSTLTATNATLGVAGTQRRRGVQRRAAKFPTEMAEVANGFADIAVQLCLSSVAIFFQPRQRGVRLQTATV